MLDRVSTVRGSGWVQPNTQNHLDNRMLIVDPSATADGTDPIQVQRLTFEAKPHRSQGFNTVFLVD